MITYPMILHGGPGDGLQFGELQADVLAPPEVGYADYTPHHGFQMWTYQYSGVGVWPGPEFYIKYLFTGRSIPVDPRLTLEG